MIGMAVAGVAGRMGGHIVRAIGRQAEAGLAGGFEAPGHPAIGKRVAEVCGEPQAGELLVSAGPGAALAQAEVLIDFTAPAVSLAHLELCARLGKAAVIGTTGLDNDQKQDVAALAARVPVVYSPNMSVGMNLMFKLAGLVARVLGPTTTRKRTPPAAARCACWRRWPRPGAGNWTRWPSTAGWAWWARGPRTRSGSA
jgi:4-hydroxy-tetrahydrodipicolinate reductase